MLDYINLNNIFLNNIFDINTLNIYFLILTALLILICIIYNSEIHIYNINYLSMLFIFLELLLIILFSLNNIFLFFIFFEATLIPMVILISVWGSRQRKIHSMYYLYLYTLIGSVFFLIGLLKIFLIAGTFDINILKYIKFDILDEFIIFICLFFSFAIKIPMWPWHIWLPEAHVESPTTGSVILAGLLLKLGTYGMIKFLIPITSNIIFFFSPLILTLSLLGVLYNSFIIIRLIDLKKIIAYSSVIHMNILIIGLFSFSFEGYGGAIFMMLNHGIVSSGLFLIVGILYDRYHSRLIFYYKGLSKYMPLYNIIFILLTLANIALPGTSTFIVEFMLFLGIYNTSSIIVFLVCTSCIFSAVYGLWLYSRAMFGVISNNLLFFQDLTERELLVFTPIITLIFIFGLIPSSFSSLTNLLINSYIF